MLNSHSFFVGLEYADQKIHRNQIQKITQKYSKSKLIKKIEKWRLTFGGFHFFQVPFLSHLSFPTVGFATSTIFFTRLLTNVDVTCILVVGLNFICSNLGPK